jgi:hypothetical protein
VTERNAACALASGDSKLPARQARFLADCGRFLSAGTAQLERWQPAARVSARPGETRSGSIAAGDNIAARQRRASIGSVYLSLALALIGPQLTKDSVMDHDALCESARIARLVGNVDHEVDQKRKLAVALILGRSEWIQAQGLSMKQAMVELGENAVRIVAAAKRTLQSEIN